MADECTPPRNLLIEELAHGPSVHGLGPEKFSLARAHLLLRLGANSVEGSRRGLPSHKAACDIRPAFRWGPSL
jgi:hypothetical protein